MKTFIRVLISVAVLSFCSHGLAAPHKLRINDPALAKALVARGGKVVGDYGAFTVLEADDSLFAAGESNRVEVADNWNLIRLNAQTVDTRTPQTKALRKNLTAFTGKRLHLVHFAGPIKPEWREALEQSGAQIVNYIPENAYLIYGDAPALVRMQAWAGASEFVQWEGEYSRDLKVHPKARAAALRSSGGQVEINTFSIQLIVDSSSNPSTLALIDSLKSAPVRRDSQVDLYRNLVVSLPSDQIDAIAAQPDVISIQPYFEPKKRDERQDQIVAGNLAGSAPSGPGYLAWLASKGFTQAQFDASGFVVDVADSGIDNGTTAPGHFGFYELGDTTSTSRVAYARVEGKLHHDGTLVGCDGHGTLNAHIIANYDDFSGSQHKDSSGYSYGVGVCPFVKVGSSVIFDNSSGASDFTDPVLATMVSDAYHSGARIINNSWGADAGGDYDSEAQTYDHLVRDADSKAAGNQEMIIVFAAGNAGPCTTNLLGIDSPGSAKNVITVGASDNVRSLSTAHGGNDADGNDFCGESDANADNVNDLACASSRGPCSDGRMKPDLIAPGIHITGGVPQNSPPPSPSSTGSAVSCFDAAGVCALPNSGGTGNPDNFFPLGQEFYTESSGTSHSTPAVAGACALIRQFFINSNFTAPSAAMTKAFLINSARYMTGLDADDTLWSPNQGMGELNLGFAFDGVPRFLRDQVSGDKFTGTGQTRVFTGQVVDPTKPFRVTVAWTDAPGSTTGAAYNNDLDLTVTIGGNTYLGNVFSGQNSTTGGSADTKNNVESVFLPAGVTGDFTVTITAANINSDGVPGEAPSLDQDFALVVYNATASNVPTFTPSAGNYSGLFYEAGGVEAGRSGAVAIKTATSSSYSGKLQLGAASYSFSGKFDSTGTATNSVARKGLSSLGLEFNVDLNDNDLITGTVTDPGIWTANLRANRAILNPKTTPAAFAGHYTLTFPGTNGGALLPAGDGYGTVTVDSTGKVKLTGSLADGTKLSQSAVASAAGEWPLYASLYSGQGQILGWLLFTNSGPESVGGDVSWIKAPISGAKFYPNGFDFGTHSMGSIYSATKNPLIGFSSGFVILDGGNLPVGITNNVNVSGATVVNQSSNKLTLKLTTSNGTLKGSVVNPATGAAIPFTGVFLQNQNFGSGYFLSTNQSGRFFFGPGN